MPRNEFMNQEEALWQTIHDEPNDNAPRLVFADWLDENGDPERAEFIRGQIQLATIRPWEDQFLPLEIRCKELLRLNSNWLGFLKGSDWIEHYPHDFGRPFLFDRGFPARVQMEPADFEANQGRLFAYFPIRRVSLRLEKLASETWSPLSTGGLHQLETVRSLAEIGFSFCRQEAAAQELLCCLDHMAPLRFFGVGGCSFSEEKARAILTCPAVQNVHSLQI